MDLWSWCQKDLLKVPPLNYALVGRWILWLSRGKLYHRTIVSTPEIAGERLTGWVFHYLTGIVFAFVPLLLSGAVWLDAPSLTLGLLAGGLTLFAARIGLWHRGVANTSPIAGSLAQRAHASGLGIRTLYRGSGNQSVGIMA